MGLVFYRINLAIGTTLEMFEKGRFKDYMRYFRNGSNSYLHDWDEHVLKTHKQMEEEIYQTVDTCNNITKVFMFEELRKWLNEDWRTAETVNFNYFFATADNHNTNQDAELESKVQEGVAKMIAHPDHNKYQANEEYIPEKVADTHFYTPAILAAFHSLNAKKIHRKFYCVEISTDYFELRDVWKYTDLLQKLVNNFRDIISRHLALYDAGKYVTPPEIIIQKGFLQHDNKPPAQIDSIKQATPKIGLNINVRELLFLFRILIEGGVIKDSTVKKNMYQHLSDIFETETTSEMTVDQLQKKYSEIDPKIADFWEDAFIYLSKKAKKHNPNNIKTNRSKLG